MAGSQTSGRRRGRASQEDRQQQYIYLAAAVILLLVVVVVAVGVVLTVILPPRAHVLSVGDESFTARDVADRAIYLVSSGNGNAQQDPAAEGIDSLIGQEVLFQVGAGRVDEVTAEDIQDAIAERLGLNPRDPEPEATPEATEEATPEATAEASPSPDATGTATPETTAEATPEGTPLPGYTDEEYADALAAFLRVAPVGRRELETIVRAGIIEDRLVEQFRAELPESGDQFLLWAVPTNDRAAAQELIDLVRGGMDFREAAVEAGVVEEPEGAQELGWFAPSSINERVAPFVQDLQSGEISEVIDDANRVGFEVYYVEERSTERPYEETVKDQLAQQAFSDWRDEQTEVLAMERDLSEGEDDWIREQVLDFISER